MTLYEQVQWLREEHFHELTAWEQEFIAEMYDGLDGLPSDVSDIELEEYLTPQQREKIQEISRGHG